MARGRVKGNIVIDVHDVVGRTFGELKVTGYNGRWYDKTLAGDKMRHSYLCQCSCGNEVTVRRQCLLNGMTKSCGCLRRESKKYGN